MRCNVSSFVIFSVFIDNEAVALSVLACRYDHHSDGRFKYRNPAVVFLAVLPFANLSILYDVQDTFHSDGVGYSVPDVNLFSKEKN